MALNITRGVVPKAQKVVIYGPEGIGKTTLAAQFPDPVFIDTEGSTEHFDLARVDSPKSWQALMGTVAAVKAERPSATLVIDTADWAERLCVADVCADKGWKSIEDPGFGKGYTSVVERFCKLLDALTDVADAGVNVVLTAHAAIRKFDQPDEAASYNRWALALIDAQKMSNAAKVKEWADAVLFANFETVVEVVGDGKGAKGKARGGQKRVLHTCHHACWDAKNRWGLPPKIPMGFDPIAPHVTDMRRATPASKNVVKAPCQQKTLSDTAPRTAEPGQTITYSAQGATVAPTAAPEQQKPSAPDLPPQWDKVLQLCSASGIAPEEIGAVAVRLKHFTADTPLANYPEDYLGFVASNWEKFKGHVAEAREASEPVPF